MISSYVEENRENLDQFLKEFTYSIRIPVHETTDLAREESSNVEQWQGKRRRSEEPSESSRNQERQHRNKKRPPGRSNWQKRSAPSLLIEDNAIKRIPQGSYKWRKRAGGVEFDPTSDAIREQHRKESIPNRRIDSSWNNWRIAQARDQQVQRCYVVTHRKEPKEGWPGCIVSSPY
ncbi:hypothetical protein TNCV_1220321 [Trichonephila clavipes]|nr:hypothetical protein TNCV_1220321 [Trichonephila clavipes]